MTVVTMNPVKSATEVYSCAPTTCSRCRRYMVRAEELRSRKYLSQCDSRSGGLPRPYPFFLAIIEMVQAQGWSPSGADGITWRKFITVDLKVRGWGHKKRKIYLFCITWYTISSCRCLAEEQPRHIL